MAESMSEDQLEAFAGARRKNLPTIKAQSVTLHLSSKVDRSRRVHRHFDGSKYSFCMNSIVSAKGLELTLPVPVNG
jgi:hypothetical protein